VPSRWLTLRTVALTVLAVGWVTGCVLAAVWQVGRAEQGNTFSYLYSVEWPALAAVGVWCWWLQMRTTPASRAARDAQRDEVERTASLSFARRRDRAHEDPELSAYNDYLEQLAAQDRGGAGGR
jgi:hypothetical protein